LAKSVQILHDFNIIHRDLKPGNILTMMKDGQLIPVIIDFGHARVFDEK
jgi:serine/threonine protein kinase